jgi:hypothetical protein
VHNVSPTEQLAIATQIMGDLLALMRALGERSE